jgi:plasmid stabilization system protein ParE
VDAARNYLNGERRGLGNDLLDEFAAAVRSIVAQPEFHSFVETLPSRLGYRRVQLQRFQYIVVFKVLESGVVIVALTHTSQRPNQWLGRLR